MHTATGLRDGVLRLLTLVCRVVLCHAGQRDSALAGILHGKKEIMIIRWAVVRSFSNRPEDSGMVCRAAAWAGRRRHNAAASERWR